MVDCRAQGIRRPGHGVAHRAGLRRLHRVTPVRVAYVITRSDTVAGAHRHVRDLSDALIASGHEARVLVGGDGPFVDVLRERGIPVKRLRHLSRRTHVLREARAVAELTHALDRSLRPDLVSLHSPKAGLLGRLVARRLGVPAVVTVHGWSFAHGLDRGPSWVRLLERSAGRLAARIITACEHERRLALSAHIASADRLVTVHAGAPDVPARLRAHPERSPCRLLMIAPFDARVDHASLLRALATLTDLTWELRLLGEGPARAEVRALALELGLAGRVHLLAGTRDVDQELADASALVAATHFDAFPRSVVLAMRAGLPVVATRVGGISEAVAHGQTGFLVERSDVDKLALALRCLIGSPGLRGELGARGRREYLRRFTFERVFEHTLSVYRTVVSGSDRWEGSPWCQHAR